MVALIFVTLAGRGIARAPGQGDRLPGTPSRGWGNKDPPELFR